MLNQTASPLVLQQIERHMRSWASCNLCNRHVFCGAYCFYRGHVPADYCFIGEGPGESENILGRPIVGSAGQLLDQIIADALGNVPVAITTAVACASYSDEGEIRPPKFNELLSCRPRLQEFVSICKPKLLIGVGKVGTDACKLFPTIPSVSIRHPGWILFQDDRVLEVQRAILQVKEGSKLVSSKPKTGRNR